MSSSLALTRRKLIYFTQITALRDIEIDIDNVNNGPTLYIPNKNVVDFCLVLASPTPGTDSLKLSVARLIQKIVYAFMNSYIV